MPEAKIVESMDQHLVRLEELVIERLRQIERRLPNDMVEFPIDRHLREIRDEMAAWREEFKNLLYVSRNGRDGVVPGLNRTEDQVSSVMKMLWLILGATVLGFGSLLYGVATDFLVRSAK